MLTVYRGNRAELLAQVLAAQLRLEPPDPFETVQVVVNTWPTSRWLGEQLALHLGGIAANLRFPFPGSHLRSLVNSLLEAPPDQDPWRATTLVWLLLELLPSIAAGPEGGVLADWWQGRDPGRRLDAAGWQLARSIADAFDDYALYRPEMLAQWEAGRSVDGADRPLEASLRWQPLLYAALRDRLGVAPFGLRVEQVIERLRRGEVPVGALPGRLRLFGLSSMAPVQVRLLQALAGSTAVDLYLLTPCGDMWQRCSDRRRELSDVLALAQPLDDRWLLEAPGLDARFGRLGAEFQQLLEGSGEAQLGLEREQDLFFAAATVAQQRRQEQGRPQQPPPLLAQLQQQLADPSSLPGFQKHPDDNSLEFHPCPGQLRQVQIVRDRLLQLLAADPSLEPRDILVMTPAVDRFAPLVASVFGDRDATGVDLPWRLTDRSQQSEAGIGRSLLFLLRLAGERLTASSLETLLESPSLQQRFAMSSEELAELHCVLQRCGFRWGLDGRDRGGDPTHSLAWAIDRLLLGLVLPETPGLAPSGTAPAAVGSDLDRSGRWLHLLLRIRHWLEQLRRPGDVSTWAQRCRLLLDDLFGDGGDRAWELAQVLAALNDWQTVATEKVATGSLLELEAPVVAAILEEGLAVDSGRFGHRSGSLTISALEPMRAIPHRVIVLMGLDAELFPRQRSRSGFHLLERQRRLGDPHPADQDRYVLLEALLSARDHLLICWSNREERTGEDLPPAPPVQQWLEWLRAVLPPGQFEGLLGEHQADPLDRRNFLRRGLRPAPSCDLRLLETRQRLDQQECEPPLGLLLGETPAAAPAGAVTAPYEDLLGWLREPQRHWLRQLGLRPAEWQERREDLEALALDERERMALLRQVLEEGDAGEAIQSPEDWIRRSRGRGTMPPGAAAALESTLLQERFESLHSILAGLGEPWQEELAWGDLQATPRWCGQSVVLVHLGRVGPKQQLQLWLELLLAAAAAPESGRPPQQGVLISRGKDDRIGIVHTFRPAATDKARDQLDQLRQLRQDWCLPCWPVPPRSGWSFVEGEQKQAGAGRRAAALTWEGDGFRRPERDDAEMVVCFGARLPAEDLLNGRFERLATQLYGPVLEARA